MTRANQGSALLRIVTGVVLLTITLTLVWMPMLAGCFSLYIAVLATLGLREYFALAGEKGVTPEHMGATLGSLAMMAAAHWYGSEAVSLSFLLAFIAVSTLHVLRGAHSIRCLAVSAMGLLYLGWLPAHFVLLHHETRFGPGLVTGLVLVVSASDTGALVVGKNFGRHKLAPAVSPKKTWEGAIGGVVGAALVSAGAGALEAHFQWQALPTLGAGWYALAGAILSVVGQAGDLAESMIKRDAGRKDSGEIFPGHGGVLDRCDGFLFAGPVLYYGFLIWGPWAV